MGAARSGWRTIDDDGFAALYARFYPTLVLVALARSRSRVDAEEAAQEAFARGYAHRRRLARMAAPESWLATVALNVVARTRRREFVRDRLLRRLDPPAKAELPAPELADLFTAVRALPLPLREVVVLHHLADLPVEQVAAILGIPAGTAKSRLYRARAALAAVLEPDAAPARRDPR